MGTSIPTETVSLLKRRPGENLYLAREAALKDKDSKEQNTTKHKLQVPSHYFRLYTMLFLLYRISSLVDITIGYIKYDYCHALQFNM